MFLWPATLKTRQLVGWLCHQLSKHTLPPGLSLPFHRFKWWWYERGDFWQGSSAFSGHSPQSVLDRLKWIDYFNFHKYHNFHLQHHNGEQQPDSDEGDLQVERALEETEGLLGRGGPDYRQVLPSLPYDMMIINRSHTLISWRRWRWSGATMATMCESNRATCRIDLWTRTEARRSERGATTIGGHSYHHYDQYFLTELIEKCSFCPQQIWNEREIYLKYLDADKMRGKSSWNIWEWEAKLAILNWTPLKELNL